MACIHSGRYDSGKLTPHISRPMYEKMLANMAAVLSLRPMLPIIMPNPASESTVIIMTTITEKKSAPDRSIPNTNCA